MPVFGNPVITPPPSSVECTEQNAVQPRTTQVEGRDNPAKRQAIQVAQGQAATVRWTMRNPQGDPVDLSSCPAATIFVRIRESMSFSTSNPGVEAAATVVDAPAGLIEVVLPAEAVAMPGISVGEFGVLSGANLLFSNVFYLVVDRSQFGPEVTELGPPSLPEIRLHMRDSAPEDNLWLGVEEFDLAEIAACVERPIRYFNELQPPLNFRYNTANFPFRYFWLEGIIACLYQMASLHYQRVHLPYQSQGGLTIDDKNKARDYAATGQARWAVYADWVQKKKVEINAKGAIQMVGSLYGWNDYMRY